MKGFEAIETEQALLGLMMVNPNTISSCQWLNDDDFAEPLHGRLFAAIMLQYSQGTDPTPFTLARKFENDPAFEDKEGKKYLFNLAKMAISVDVAGGAKELRKAATKRNTLRVCQESIAKLQEASGVDDEPEKHLNDLMARLNSLQDGYMEKRLVSSQQVVAEIIEGFKKQSNVYDTGFKGLNAAMGGGLIQGRSYGIGARMKMGKTAMLATLAQNLNRNDVNVLYVALEMGSEQIMQRILGRELKLNPNEFLKQQGSAFHEKVAGAHRDMPDNLYFLDMAGVDFTRLKTMLTSFVRKKKIQVVIIDYWQLIGGKDNRQNESAHLDTVAQWIAEFSKAEKVASITASQINQQGNTRGGEGIKLAFDQVYALQDCEVDGGEYRYLDMMSTRYTQWLSLGQKKNNQRFSLSLMVFILRSAMQPLNQIIDKILTSIEDKMKIDTQLQAYAEIQTKAAALRTKVRRALSEGAMTTEEICDHTGEEYKSIQPRTSELHDSLEIFDTRVRRLNESGKKAIVWQLVETDEQRDLAAKQTIKKMKPIGDPKLFGRMMQAKYAYAAQKDQINAIKLNNALLEWGFNSAEKIRKKKFSAEMPQAD